MRAPRATDVAEDIIHDFTRHFLHRAACIDEKRPQAHPEHALIDRGRSLARNGAAGRSDTFKTIDERRPLVGRGMRIDVGQDQRLATRPQRLHDLPRGLQLEVASFVCGCSRPEFSVFAVGPLHLARISACPQSEQKPLLGDDQADVVGRSIRDGDAVVRNVQIPRIQIAIRVGACHQFFAPVVQRPGRSIRKAAAVGSRRAVCANTVKAAAIAKVLRSHDVASGQASGRDVCNRASLRDGV